MKLTATAILKTRLSVTAVTRSRLSVSASIRSNQPTGPACPEITAIDGGAPDSVYTPVYGTINGGTP